MRKRWICASIIATLLFSACSKDDDTTTDNTTTQTTSVSKQDVKEHYADLVLASYEDSYTTAITLEEAVKTFTTTPTQANFDLAKKAWLDAREPYGQTEAYRFYDGPIDDSDGPEGLLNAWPLDEVYIDYVSTDPNAGIINNTTTYPTIDAALLESLNEVGGEANVSVGYHAIEFLLWGQDTTSPSEKKSGQRSYTDYVISTKEERTNTATSTINNQERRATYLKLASAQIVSNLSALKNEWAVGGTYRTTFLALEDDKALQKIFTGIGILSKSELAGERIFVAYDNQDQEDEHSCFSDNTHRDIILNALGIKNVYTGNYTKVDGTLLSGASLYDLVKEKDENLANELSTALTTSVRSAESISIPFDNAITDASTRPAVLTTVTDLKAAGDKIADAAQALGITINTNLPD